MVVMTPRESWTDARLDEFKESVNQRFDAVDKRFDRVDADLRELRTTMMQGFFALGTIMVTGFGIMIAGFGFIAF
jgi:hypothetical protein